MKLATVYREYAMHNTTVERTCAKNRADRSLPRWGCVQSEKQHFPYMTNKSVTTQTVPKQGFSNILVV